MKKITRLTLTGVICLLMLWGCSTKTLVWKSNYPSKYSIRTEDLSNIDFMNSLDIVMSKSFKNVGSVVENGVVIFSDTAEYNSRIIYKNTPGRLVGIPQKNPGDDVFQSFKISFIKNDVPYEFTFDRIGDGSYVLNKNATAIFEGKEYEITVLNGNNSYQQCKLNFKLKENPKVIIEDNQ